MISFNRFLAKQRIIRNLFLKGLGSRLKRQDTGHPRMDITY